MNTKHSKSEDLWTMIDAEKRRDRVVQRVSVIAWSITMLVLLVFAGMVGRQVAETMRRVDVGVAPSGAVWEALLPLVAVVGAVSLLIAVLATVGVFLRLRTASLSEIQVRLATLEQMVTEQSASRA